MVLNQGSQDVIVEVRIDSAFFDDDPDRDSAVIPAGEYYEKGFPHADDLDIFITRRSDGTMLYAASFDLEDFEDEHSRIEIVVTP